MRGRYTQYVRFILEYGRRWWRGGGFLRPFLVVRPLKKICVPSLTIDWAIDRWRVRFVYDLINTILFLVVTSLVAQRGWGKVLKINKKCKKTERKNRNLKCMWLPCCTAQILFYNKMLITFENYNHHFILDIFIMYNKCDYNPCTYVSGDWRS